jgi:hypothetical protein
MTYVCIKCRTIWQAGLASEAVSGGLCGSCIIEYVRGKQRKKGFHDCFKRATETCSRTECDYHNLCNRDLGCRA